MKNFAKVIVVIVVVLSAVSASADTLTTRVSGTRGSAPSQDILVSTEHIDVSLFGVNTSSPIVEVGHLWVVSQSKHHLLMVGAYGSHWSGADKDFVEPYLYAQAYSGRTTVTVGLYGYIPLNGGGTYAGVDELSLKRKVSKHLEVGVMGKAFKANPGTFSLKWGPTVKLTRGKMGVSVYYLCEGEGADTFRLALSRSF